MSRTKIVLWAFVIAMLFGFFALLAMQSGCQAVAGAGRDITWMSEQVMEGDRK